jgi:hypothetical protein
LGILDERGLVKSIRELVCLIDVMPDTTGIAHCIELHKANSIPPSHSIVMVTLISLSYSA